MKKYIFVFVPLVIAVMVYGIDYIPPETGTMIDVIFTIISLPLVLAYLFLMALSLPFWELYRSWGLVHPAGISVLEGLEFKAILITAIFYAVFIFLILITMDIYKAVKIGSKS